MARKILVVDDEVQMVRLLASRLKGSGYEVATAYDGQQCVKMAREERPDLIILDLKMPEGGGLYAFKRLKASAKTAAIPVIFITAYPTEHALGKVLGMGAKAFIPKPIDVADFLWKVRRALGEEHQLLRKERSRRSSNLGREPSRQEDEMARKILVVDDEVQMVRLLASRLKGSGYEVATAYDGQQCVKMAREERPDLIILDLKMPEGGGLYAFKRLKASAKTAAIPVIFITAYPTEHALGKVLGMGAKAFIPKPIDVADFLWKVRRALGEEHQLLRKERSRRSSNLGREPSRQEDEMARKILVVDDEVQMVRLLASRLKGSGYEVATAYDGQQCVKMAREEKPDLVVLDLVMPEGGGLYAFRRLKASAKTAAIPVIFITGYPTEHVEEKVLEMGAEDFVVKPFDSDDLLKKVRKALGEEPEPVGT